MRGREGGGEGREGEGRERGERGTRDTRKGEESFLKILLRFDMDGDKGRSHLINKNLR